MPSASKKPVLSLQNVTKSFGSFKAVNDVTIDVFKGEIFGFLGPNGAGKSTTIRLILDILRADSGTISIHDKNNRDIQTVHQEIGFLSGDMVLDEDLTGKQYLEFVNNLRGGTYEIEIERLARILDADLRKKIGSYSRGNRQKIGLISALFANPKLLILDEPTSGFDPLIQEKFADLIREYVQNGGTVFMSSHILAEVQHLCDRVAFIRNGRIVATKSVDDLLITNTKRIEISASSSEMKKIIKEYSRISGLELIDQQATTATFSYSGPMRSLLSYLAPLPVTDLTIRDLELEEIFGQYYEESEEA